ncbi:MAG: GMC family oxidoreductase, partial [Vicinamibacteria bacterium]
MNDLLYAGGGATGPDDLSCAILYGRTLGGSSVHYMANSFRAPEFKLERWRREFGLDWAAADAMARYYEIAERDHNVHDATEFETNENNRMFRRGVEALGWKGHPSRHARKNCVNAGTCLLGCPFDSKQSQLLTNIPKIDRLGGRIYTDCRAEHVLLDRGRAAGISAAFADSKTGEKKGILTVHSRITVIAAGGVGTPAFFLRNGLANSSGLVGQNFQVTPHFFAMGIFGHKIYGYRGMPCSYVVHQFEEVRGDEGGYMIQGIFAQPAMTAYMLPGFGDEHRDLMELYTRGAALLSLLDDEEPGRVSVRKDGRVRLEYRLRGRDIPKARDFFKKTSMILLSAGAERVMIPAAKPIFIKERDDYKKIDRLSFEPNRIPFVGTSNLGTCRMGRDPKRSVTDPYGQTHDVRGLFICDASLFPTSIAVDPSLT